MTTTQVHIQVKKIASVESPKLCASFMEPASTDDIALSLKDSGEVPLNVRLSESWEVFNFGKRSWSLSLNNWWPMSGNPPEF